MIAVAMPPVRRAPASASSRGLDRAEAFGQRHRLVERRELERHLVALALGGDLDVRAERTPERVTQPAGGLDLVGVQRCGATATPGARDDAAGHAFGCPRLLLGAAD